METLMSELRFWERWRKRDSWVYFNFIYFIIENCNQMKVGRIVQWPSYLSPSFINYQHFVDLVFPLSPFPNTFLLLFFFFNRFINLFFLLLISFYLLILRMILNFKRILTLKIWRKINFEIRIPFSISESFIFYIINTSIIWNILTYDKCTIILHKLESVTEILKLSSVK